MEKNTTNYKFLNAKDRASERKNSHGILDSDRYHYKTAPHVQTGKRIFHTVCDVPSVQWHRPAVCDLWGNACP